MAKSGEMLPAADPQTVQGDLRGGKGCTLDMRNSPPPPNDVGSGLVLLVSASPSTSSRLPQLQTDRARSARPCLRPLSVTASQRADVDRTQQRRRRRRLTPVSIHLHFCAF